MIVEKCSSHIGALCKAFPYKRQLAKPTDHTHQSQAWKSKHDRPASRGHNINSALIHDGGAWWRVQSALLKVRPFAFGRSEALPIERHTQDTRCAFQPSTWEVQSPWTMPTERTSFFNLSLRKCARYVCNTPAAPSKPRKEVAEPAEPAKLWSWTSKGGRSISVWVPQRIGKPPFGAPWSSGPPTATPPEAATAGTRPSVRPAAVVLAVTATRPRDAPTSQPDKEDASRAPPQAVLARAASAPGGVCQAAGGPLAETSEAMDLM